MMNREAPVTADPSWSFSEALDRLARELSEDAAPRTGQAPERREALIDQAYEAYRRLCEAGQAPDMDVFCQAHPEIEGSLGRLIAFHHFMSGGDEKSATTDAPPPAVPAT